MSPFDLLPAWPAILVQFAIGRVVLSLLPGGRPGGHVPRELFATWGASHVLGSIVFAAQFEWCAAAGLDAPTWLLLVPWGALLIGRVLVLPGSVTPRHEPAEPSPTPLTWLGRAALVGGLSRVLVDDGLEHAANLAAICALLLEAMRCLRRGPTGRGWLVAAFAWTPAVTRSLTLVPASGPAWAVVALAAAGGIAWTRRADARGLALAAAGAVGAAAIDARLLLVAPLAGAGLVAVTPAPGRRRAVAVVLGTGLLVVTPLLLQDLGARGAWRDLDVLSLGAGSLPWAILGMSLFAAWRPSAVQRPGREVAWLLLLGCATALGVERPPDGMWAQLALHLVLPVSALAASFGLPVEAPS